MMTDLSSPARLTVGISGASGICYGIRILQRLQALPIETHLVMSSAAKQTLAYETDLSVADVERLADVVHHERSIGASIASGSFPTLGMIVAPCSMRSMADIASGSASTLLTRAADVVLKERRRLVLMVRETPLHAGHLRQMTLLSELGAIIAPPVPAFYARPTTLDEMIDHTVGRVLDLFDINVPGVHRWNPRA